MRFIVEDRRLETDEGELIKVFDCPLEKRWEDLMPWTDGWQDRELNDHKRLCGACQKCVVNFQPFTEVQIIALVQVNPGVCGYLRTNHPDLREIVGDLGDDATQDSMFLREDGASCTYTQAIASGERVIKTARSLLALREAVDRGCTPMFVPNTETGRTHQKLSVVYDRRQRQLTIAGDYRSMVPFDQDQIDLQYGKGAGISLWQDLRRHPSPLAAYLLPPDIQVGERVFLEDLIEDRVGSSWNQGDTYRARSGFAVWRGDHLELEQGEDEYSGPMVLG